MFDVLKTDLKDDVVSTLRYESCILCVEYVSKVKADTETKSADMIVEAVK